MSFNLLTSALDWRQSHLGRLLGHAMRRFDERVLVGLRRREGVRLERLAAAAGLGAAELASLLPLNKNSVELVGLVTTGIEFTPPVA